MINMAIALSEVLLANPQLSNAVMLKFSQRNNINC